MIGGRRKIGTGGYSTPTVFSTQLGNDKRRCQTASDYKSDPHVSDEGSLLYYRKETFRANKDRIHLFHLLVAS